MEQPHQVSQRADGAEQSALEKAAHQHEYHHKSADIKARAYPREYRRYGDSRAEIAEIADRKAQPDEYQHHAPFNGGKGIVHFFVHRNALDLCLLAYLVHDILYKPHRAEKSAYRATENERKTYSACHKYQNAFDRQLEQLIEM